MNICLNPRPIGDDVVPCGKCINCLKRRAQEWVFRLQEEQKYSKSAAFLTCTYEDDQLPFSPNGLMTVNARHHQLFLKKLRKRLNKEGWKYPIKYYAVGEYGEQTSRPHFHYIIFNLPQLYLRFQEPEEDLLTEIWNHGYVDKGNVTPASIAYVTGYMFKGFIKREDEIDDRRVKRLSFMSKGLGKGYLTDAMIRYYQNKIIPYLTIENGDRFRMPRYYKEKLYDNEDRNKMREKVYKYLEENDPDWKTFTDMKKEVIRKHERKKREKTRDLT